MLTEKECLQLEVQSWAITLIHLKKSLEKDECKLGEFSKSRDKARQKVTKCQLKCENLNIILDYIVVEKYRAMVATIVANLKKRERDFEFQLFLVDNQREKMQEG
jgi:hypothetical protein